MADDPDKTGRPRLGLRRPGHHRPRGSRGRAQAAGHVHRLDRCRAACTTWSTRSSTTPSTRRWPALRRGRGHDPPRQLGHGRRQRPRHPGRHDGEGGQVGARGRADRPARRRQVRRRRRLQGVRRPARRRRLRRQRAVRAAATSRSGATAFAWRQDYERGAPQGPIDKGEPTEETGTTITFLPDAEIFETLDFDFATLEQRLRETAFLTRGLRISHRRRARPTGHTAPSSTTRAASGTSSPT